MQFHIDFLRFGDKVILNDVFGSDEFDKRCIKSESSLDINYSFQGF